MTTIDADHIVSALPAKQLATLIGNHPSSKDLSGIDIVDVAVVNLRYAGQPLKIDGFGFLVPKTEVQNTDLLGVVFDSCAIPQQSLDDSTRLTAMMGGHMFEQKFGSADSANPDQLLENAVLQVHKYLGINPDLLVESHTIIQRSCIPQYNVGHKDRINRIFADLKSVNSIPISLIGASYKGVSINDVIYNARIAANEINES